MNQTIRQLLEDIEGLKRSLGKVSSKQIKSSGPIDKVRSFVYTYFKDFRPIFLSVGLAEDVLRDLDATMQDLLLCTQRQTLASRYFRCLTQTRQALHGLELKSLSPTTEKYAATNDPKQQKILETLEKLCASAAVSYEQALLDLQATSRKSWRGTAVELREALRELLDVMAPDENVKAQSGFKLEPDAKRPTMKQKTVFILKSRRLSGTQQRTPAEAVEVADTQVGKFVRSVYDRSSAGTHTSISKNEVIKIKEYVTLVLADLLEINV